MPPRRKYVRRKRAPARVTRSMQNRLSTIRSRGLTYAPSKPHGFKYIVSKGPLTFSTGSSSTSLGLTFSLSDIGNAAELIALFDQFRLDKVVVKITPTFNSIDAPSIASSMITPQIFTAIDYDDNTAPPSEASIREFGSCKETNGSKAHIRTLVPKVLTMAYKTALTTAYAPAKSAMYIDCADSTVPHYGLKVYMNNGGMSGSGSPWSARIECRYYVSLKNQC